MFEFFKKLGFGEKPVELTLDQELAIITAKASNAHVCTGVSDYIAGTAGIEVEELTHNEFVRILAASKKKATIDCLHDPTMELVDEPIEKKDPDAWGGINPKGRLGFGG